MALFPDWTGWDEYNKSRLERFVQYPNPLWNFIHPQPKQAVPNMSEIAHKATVLTPMDVEKMITRLLDCRSKTTFEISGRPGIGKTQLMRQVGDRYAAATGKKVHTSVYNFTTYDAAEMGGDRLPVSERVKIRRKDGTTREEIRRRIHNFEPTWVPDRNVLARVAHWIIVIDEWDKIQTECTKPMAQLIDERRINDLYLDDLGAEHVLLVLTSNPASSKNGSSRQLPYIINRKCTVEMVPHLPSLERYLVMSGAHHQFTGFVKAHPHLIVDTKPPIVFAPYTTPRSAERAFQTVCAMFDVKPGQNIPVGADSTQDKLMRSVFEGLMGSENASEVMRFLALEGIMSIDDILADPAKVTIPENPAVMWQLINMAVHHITDRNAEKLWVFMNRLPADMRCVTVQNTIEFGEPERAAALMCCGAYTDDIGKHPELYEALA